MDAKHFDSLVRVLAAASPRRRLVALLLSLPLGGGLAAVLGDEVTEAHGRRRRRKKHHKHRKGDGKDNRKGKRKDPQNGKSPQPSPPPASPPSPPPPGCMPQPQATTCAGKCATVTNNCGAPVDCGPCTCATGCPSCQICNTGTGACDPVADDTPCDDGDACTQSDTCQGGVCVGANAITCPPPSDQCHVQGTCDPATGLCSNPPQQDGTACDDGDACTTGDACQAGVCTGSPVSCDQPPVCRTTTGATCQAGQGTCTYPTLAPDLTACGSGDVCCGGDCVSGTCCHNTDCASTPTTPICGSAHTCICTATSQCPANTVCCNGACVTGTWTFDTRFGETGPNAIGGSPGGPAVSADGQTLWVALPAPSFVSVWRLTAGSWTHLTDIGSSGSGADQFSAPQGLDVAPDGQTVWVADSANGRVSVWRLSGGTWTHDTNFGDTGPDPLGFNADVAVSPDGQTAWVSDFSNGRIVIWHLSGGTWTRGATFGSSGSGAAQLSSPQGLTVSADGQTVWVADLNNNRISVWRLSGGTWSHDTNFGSAGTGPDQFTFPSDVAVSADGQTVWVADSNGHRVAIWHLSGGTWTPPTTFAITPAPRFAIGVAVASTERTLWVSDQATFTSGVSVWQLACPSP